MGVEVIVDLSVLVGTSNATYAPRVHGAPSLHLTDSNIGYSISIAEDPLGIRSATSTTPSKTKATRNRCGGTPGIAPRRSVPAPPVYCRMRESL